MNEETELDDWVSRHMIHIVWFVLGMATFLLVGGLLQIFGVW